RHINDARTAAAAVTAALARIDQQLTSVRRWACIRRSDGALDLLAPLEGRRDAVRADSAPLLALAPPPAPALSELAAFDSRSPEWAAYDAAEVQNQASWE